MDGGTIFTLILLVVFLVFLFWILRGQSGQGDPDGRGASARGGHKHSGRPKGGGCH